MTWTVFEHNAGDNETDAFAPGRGGYKYVLVPLDQVTAMEWWKAKFGKGPTRDEPVDPYNPRHGVEMAWKVYSHDDPEKAREHCGEMELESGGIGSPMKRYYTWAELRGRLDVKVVTADEIESSLWEDSTNDSSETSREVNDAL